MFLIVLCHAVPVWENESKIGLIDIGKAADSYKGFLTIIINYLGQIGNCVFICCSAWFLLDSKKLKVKKVLYIIVDTFFISIIILIACIIGGYDLTFKEIIKCIFPVSFNNNWFIGCYILYYIIHPILNRIINSLSQRELLRVNIFLVIYFYIWQFIFKTIYTSFMGFIILHFIVAYIKKYMSNYSKNIKLNTCMLLVSILGFVSSIAILDILSLNFFVSSNIMTYMENLINPFVVIISISIFNLFINKKFINKIINYISSLTLYIYIIHHNILLRSYTISAYYKKIYLTYGYDHINLIILLTAILVFIASTILASIYKETIKKIAQRICNYLYEIIKVFILKLEGLLIKLN